MDDKHDWREQCQAHVQEDTYLPSTGQTARKGAEIHAVNVVKLNGPQVTTGFPVPNATALFLGASAEDWARAKDIWRRNEGVVKDNGRFSSYGEGIEYLTSIVGAIINAFSSLEAFANEVIDLVPEDGQHGVHLRSKTILEPLNREKKERLERKPVSEKLSRLLPEALVIRSPKDLPLWNEFDSLKCLRDRIIHMKAADRTGSDPANPNIWHDIVHAPCPHERALKLIDFFLAETNNRPEWRDNWPY